MKNVIVVTGIGGMGMACARRMGMGLKLVLCDFDENKLKASYEELSASGYDVTTIKTDVSDKASVEAAAGKAVSLGNIRAIIHTAGLSPTMASAERLFAVDLIGTARMIEAFEAHLSAGMVGVFVSSSSGYLGAELTQEQRQQIITLKADDLVPYLSNLNIIDSGQAYVLSKRANRLQVQAAAVRWGKKGARIMSVSPGIISTPMGQKEQQASPTIDYMIKNAPTQRIGTPEDIAAVTEFIISPAASFLSGSDILVDGGVTALFHTSPSQ